MADSTVTVPMIVVTEGKSAGKEFKLNDRAVFEIGRAASSNIEIPDAGVAMNHCRIYREQGVFTLYDLNTTKGTYINGDRITKDTLKDGDTIQIGPVLMIFQNPDAPSVERESSDDADELDFDPPSWDLEEEKGPRDIPEEKDTGVIVEEPIVEEAPPAAVGMPRLTVLEGPIAGTVFDLEGKDLYTIGRAADADVKIMDIKISRHHTRISKEEGNWYAVDRDSRNGTFLNGEQVNHHIQKDGDHLKIGFSIMQFNLIGATPPKKAEEPIIPLEKDPSERKAKKKPKSARKPKKVISSEVRTKPHRKKKVKTPPAAEDLTCDLCSRSLSRDDLDSGLAVAHQGKHYCLTCVRKLQNLAGGTGGGRKDSGGGREIPKESLDDEDIDLLLKEEVSGEEEDLFP